MVEVGEAKVLNTPGVEAAAACHTVGILVEVGRIPYEAPRTVVVEVGMARPMKHFDHFDPVVRI